ncbi:hypothetical protein [Paenibacillus sacheonensis]|uniref:Uncharacterized protein n=1 Tax=Paenibacillus sacheonensis TaxID=742054 RepID=A0A7X4YS08_9BACL|nr:hypothetical protein [Paenibacillus sacheonensis]MBM7566858.1 hypothetical protein [Paenibacillus sacheonensis]NBC71480.1 hypothetical protein [Paenibacillus sacheonensis]
MKERRTGRIALTPIRTRLLSAVLIAMAVTLCAGCSASNRNADNAASEPARPSALISTEMSAGKNPFEVAGIENPQAFIDVFDTVKTAIAQGDKAEVANRILYPLRVNGPSGSEKIQTRGDFVKRYDAIITQPIKDAIARQSSDNLFVNYQGVMVGNGEMWFAGSADTPQVIGIIAINHDFDGGLGH